MQMTFLEQLQETITHHNSLLCVGLDVDLHKIPQHLQAEPDAIYLFNKAIIDATSDMVCAYKPQIAHYSAYGETGLKALEQTISYIKDTYEHIPVILDAKRGDIGTTTDGYVKEAFDVLQADAVTVNPYLGFDSLQPFFEQKDKGIIVLCRTSNKSASDFQDLMIDHTPLYIHIAKKIKEWNDIYKNILMVVGATWPEELKEVRNIAPDMFFLVPGIGAQGGDVEKTLQAGLRGDKSGLIITSSRAIIYASNGEDFAQKAREKAGELKEQINRFRL
jgi:orotidine-5'-phosphate decarboxylase